MQQRHMNWIVRVKDSFPARNVLGKRVCEAWLDVCHARVRCQSCQWEQMSETWNCHGFSCHLSLTLEAPKREPMRTMGSAWPGTFAQIFHFRKASPADITEPVCCWTWADLKKTDGWSWKSKTMGWYGMLFDMSHEFFEVLRSCLILGLCF